MELKDAGSIPATSTRLALLEHRSSRAVARGADPVSGGACQGTAVVVYGPVRVERRCDGLRALRTAHGHSVRGSRSLRDPRPGGAGLLGRGLVKCRLCPKFAGFYVVKADLLIHMTTLRDKAVLFDSLHRGEEALLLANAWDVASARLIEEAGAKAIATTSAGVAWSLGSPDGDRLDRDRALDLVARIAAAVDVPVTADIESGFGDTPKGSPRPSGECWRRAPWE
nr:hypothetical protein GCM10020093_094190 [Planobispora longispora]